MGLAELPPRRVLAFPAHRTGHVCDSELVPSPAPNEPSLDESSPDERGAAARPASVARQPLRCPLFHPLDAVVRFDRRPADFGAAGELASEKLAPAECPNSSGLAQRRDPFGHGGLCRTPHRPGNPKPAAG